MAPYEGNGGGRGDNLPQAGGKEVGIDHDKMKRIAKELQKDLDALKESRLQGDLEDHGRPGIAAIGDYAAGRGLNATVNAAQSSITTTYTQFLTAYQNVITALENSEKSMADADANAKAGTQQVGGGQYAG